ncbi:MAG: hypothetical protein UR56_C0008G0022 [Candidatus Roizmanbacteria bacterium GW2011_GWC2_34_23]|uniref:Uncharacterized protein n=1 Tax=Candidatus Roizmanbacteria bacterium GW2011_GWC2_34_23 TaxID=1618484 RepID=A0A0G0AX04_9BACT|nr:MAG: hypothetical protein UR56_C0008G0022 [Candidatus Roizmanbacteria bacterium GW2011_GWC2_34_23]
MKKTKKLSFYKRDGFKLFFISLAAIFLLLSVIFINKMKATTDTEAAGKCTNARIMPIGSGNRLEGASATCRRLAKNYNTPFDYRQDDKLEKSGYACCIAKTQDSTKLKDKYGQDCNSIKIDGYKGKAEWYSKKNYDNGSLQKDWAKNYNFTIQNVTGLVSSYFKGKNNNKVCLIFGSLTPKVECKGDWYKTGGGPCSSIKSANGQYNYIEASSQPSNTLRGYKDGFMCCQAIKIKSINESVD